MSIQRRRLAIASIAWFGVLVWIFMGLVGDWTAINWVGAGSLAAVAATATLPLTRQGLFRVRVDVRWLRVVPSTAKQIFVDFWIVSSVLVASVSKHRRRTVGSFVGKSGFNTGGKGPRGTAWRAFVTVTSTLSPNSYVIDIDPETGNRLSHDLVPNQASESPA